MNHAPGNVDVLPLQGKELVLPEPGEDGRREKATVPLRRCREQRLDLCPVEDAPRAGAWLPVGAALEPVKGVRSDDAAEDRVLEEHLQHKGDALHCPRRVTPRLELSQQAEDVLGLDLRDRHRTELRQDQLLEAIAVLLHRPCPPARRESKPFVGVASERWRRRSRRMARGSVPVRSSSRCRDEGIAWNSGLPPLTS